MKPSIKILKKSAQTYGIELPKGSLEGAISAMEKYFIEKYGEENLAACGQCQHVAPESIDGQFIPKCLYCDETFIEGPAEKSTPIEKTVVKNNQENLPIEEDQVTSEEPQPEIVKPAKKRGRRKKKTENTDPNKTVVATKRGRKPKQKTEEIVPEKELSQEQIAQRQELDRHLTRIMKLRGDMARNAWDIGNHLNEISENNLWKGMGFDNFFSFIHTQVGISRSLAFTYIACSKKFTRAEFTKIGVKKGALITAAPPEHQETLTQAAKKGKSFTDLKKILRKSTGTQTSAAPTDQPTPKLTLLGRVDDGEFFAAWRSKDNHEEIESPDQANKYIVIDVTNEIELAIEPSEDRLGLLMVFRKKQEEAVENYD